MRATRRLRTATTVALLGAALLGTALVGPAATATVPAAPAAPAVVPPPAVLDPSPPGSNDFTCRPSVEHPNPVVLVHGLTANQFVNWRYLAPILADEGYCVFSLTYGRNPLAPPPLSQIGGLTRMEDSARELASFVERVRTATGAEKVDIVGHSEGSLMPNHWVRFLGGDEVVDTYVGMTPLWDGTRLLGASDLDALGRGFGLDAAYGPLIAPLCASCRQFLRGSEFLEQMSSDGGPAVDGVDYTMILTRFDAVVVPFTSGLLEGADNIVIQDVCPNNRSGHAGIAFDPVNAQLVSNALDPDDARPIRC